VIGTEAEGKGMDSRLDSTKDSFAAREKRLRWAAVIFGTLVMGIGCNPAMMLGVLMPDEKIPPRVALESHKKETTLVVMASFARPLDAEFQPELHSVDRELAERLAQHIKKRFDDNRNKIKIVPYYQVTGYLNKTPSGNLLPKADIAKHFKADFLVHLEINSMSFYEKGYRQMFRGQAEINVSVFDPTADAGGLIFQEIYTKLYPESGPRDAGGQDASFNVFRAMFLDHMADDLSCWFAAHPKEKHHMD
jgi:hypothetical protein